MELYHYTCVHSSLLLGHGEVTLLPWTAVVGRDIEGPWDQRHAIWVTDLARPERKALGLTMRVVKCDRTSERYRVLEPELCVKWTAFARHLDRSQRESLEQADGARPAHWWLAMQPLRAVYDPREWT